MRDAIADLFDFEGLEVESVDKSSEDGIVFNVKPSGRPCCPSCGSTVVAKNGAYNRTCQDIPYGRKQIILKLRDHQYRCLNESCTTKIFVPQIPLFPKHGRMTARLEEAIAEDAFGKSTFSSVASQYHTSVETVRRIFLSRLKHYEETVKYAPVTHLGIDEVHLADEMRLVLVDTSSVPAKLIDILPSRTKSTVIHALNNLCQPEGVKTVTMDMSASYRDAVEECLPHAKIVVDHFHVTMHLIEAMERIRRHYYEYVKKDIASIPDLAVRAEKEACLAKLGMNHYWFKTNAEDLNPLSARKLAALIKAYPTFGIILSLKEQFRNVYKAETKALAITRYNRWVSSIPGDELYEPFRDFSKMVDRWHQWIFNYFDEPAGQRHSNGPVEAINGSIKRVMRDGCGYKFEILRGKLLYGDKITSVQVPVRETEKAFAEFLTGDTSTKTLSCMKNTLKYIVDSGGGWAKRFLDIEDYELLKQELIANNNLRASVMAYIQEYDKMGEYESVLVTTGTSANELYKDLLHCLATAME